MIKTQKLALISISLLLIFLGLFNLNKFNLLKFDSNSAQNITVNAMNTASDLNKIDQDLLKANRIFAFKLFTNIVNKNGDKNLMISPISVNIALNLLYNGADGESKKQMAEVLGIENFSLSDINLSSQELLNFLESQSDLELSIANSLWLKEGFSFESQFLKNNQKYFQAQIRELDFNNPDSKNIINDWVNNETRGKIPTIIDSISPENVLFLINAIYFKGNWTQEFDPNLTKSQPFYVNKNDLVNVQFMSQTDVKMYYENDAFQAIKLSYGKDANLSMYIFLPKENSNLSNLINNLTVENWQQWQNNFKQEEGLISLPKFKLEYEINLNETLQTLGMTDIFQDSANFQNMTTSSVTVDEVKHKTFIEVNEKGTEAAATTSIGVRVTSVLINQPFKMIVNRPFLYAIEDNQTKTILFIGQVIKP